MDLTVNRHDNLATISGVIIALAVLGALGFLLAAFMLASPLFILYALIVAFNGWLASAVLDWMRSVYVSLYNLNRLAQKHLPSEAPTAQ